MPTSLLQTDGYKFSMGEAGWPLRRETFYASHRKGGLQIVPFDIEAELRGLLPAVRTDDWATLAAQEYEVGSGYRAGILRQDLTIHALPKFALFHNREPIFSVTGTSALTSWLEPLVLQWSYRIQVATAALFAPETLAEGVKVATCEKQRELILQTLDAVKVKAPEITVDSEGYVKRVEARVRELVALVGNPGRLFEVGLRAASCVEQHLLALEGCKRAGLARTSHVYGAHVLGMTAVGTMGHEHVQRYGSDDAAFRAMVERRPDRSSFLLDTFDTITSGIPAAFKLISERAGARDSIRYDSGDKEAQYRHAVALSRKMGIAPIQILEDGFDAAQTARFEELRRELNVPEQQQVYGYGGYLVAQTAGTPFTRDRVAAVYKLSQTGHRATMKFGNEAGSGKQSIPGRPLLCRATSDSGAWGLVVQEGEQVPVGYEVLRGSKAELPTAAQVASLKARTLTLELSAQTKALVDELTRASFGRPVA